MSAPSSPLQLPVDSQEPANSDRQSFEDSKRSAAPAANAQVPAPDRYEVFNFFGKPLGAVNPFGRSLIYIFVLGVLVWLWVYLPISYLR